MNRFGLFVVLAGLFVAGTAQAQYLPTPAPDETTDLGTGANIGCERAYGVAACGGRGEGHPHVDNRPDVWGAVAVSPALAWGDSWNYNSEKAAKDAALANCLKQKDGKGCHVVGTVADVCMALVTSKPEKVFAVGGPIGAGNFAQDNGTLKCRRAGGSACKVAASFCADGQRHDLKGQTVFSNGNPIFVPQGQSTAAFGRRR
jgi:hypothetical protein